MRTLFILLFVSFSLFADNIDNYAKEMEFQRDYTTALTKAKKENKVLIMVLSSDYCPWCRKFERKTLSSKLIKPKLQNEFITLVVDKKYDADSFPSQFKTQFTPMVFMIDPKNENVLIKTTGYVKKKEFLNSLEFAEGLYRDSE